MFDNWVSLFLYLSFIFSLFILSFYWNLIRQKSSLLLWHILYLILFVLFFFTIIVVLTFRYGKFLIYILFKAYNLQMVLKSPQELLDMLFGVSFWLLIILFIFIFLVYINVFLLSILRNEEYKYYKFFEYIFLYFLFISLLLFWYDLSSFHTDVFMQQSQFKFEPDILKWYKYYASEYLDFVIFLLVFVFFYMCLFSSYFERLILRGAVFKFIPLVFVSGLFFYFFGGESFYRDCFYLLFSLVFCEILNYTLFLLYFLRRYK